MDRRRCGSGRGCPLLSSHTSCGAAPQVRQRNASAFLGLTLFGTVSPALFWGFSFVEIAGAPSAARTVPRSSDPFLGDPQADPKDLAIHAEIVKPIDSQICSLLHTPSTHRYMAPHVARLEVCGNATCPRRLHLSPLRDTRQECQSSDSLVPTS